MIWLVGYILFGVITSGVWLGVLSESDRATVKEDPFVLLFPAIWPLALAWLGVEIVSSLVSGFISAIKSRKDELTGNGKPED